MARSGQVRMVIGAHDRPVRDVIVTVAVAIALAIAFMYLLLSLAFSGWGP